MKRSTTLSIPILLFLTIACAAPTHQTEIKSVPLAIQEPLDSEAVADSAPEACPSDMVEVNGEYCPYAAQECLQWVDSDNNPVPPPGGDSGRCREWKNPVKCTGPKFHKHYCIDKFEFPNKEGQLPQDWMTWYDVENSCKAESKRMCTRSEWTLAAEGPNMHPYPYGDGFHRDKTICNFDNHVKGVNIMKVADRNSEGAQILRGLLKPSGSMSQCVSDWGVHDMSGNIDEWVVNESHNPYVSGLMGGHVFGVRNASRPMTEAHGPTFSWYETGGRCCKDAS
jgi:formylglycine-generating enzyme